MEEKEEKEKDEALFLAMLGNEEGGSDGDGDVCDGDVCDGGGGGGDDEGGGDDDEGGGGEDEGGCISEETISRTKESDLGCSDDLIRVFDSFEIIGD